MTHHRADTTRADLPAAGRKKARDLSHPPSPSTPTAIRSRPAHGEVTAAVCLIVLRMQRNAWQTRSSHKSRDGFLALHLLVVRRARLPRGRVPAEHRVPAPAAAGTKHLGALDTLGLVNSARRAAKFAEATRVLVRRHDGLYFVCERAKVRRSGDVRAVGGLTFWRTAKNC